MLLLYANKYAVNMKLEYFLIKGFRRVYESKIQCGDATFLIGENNIGKSSVLKAIDFFFSETSKLSDEDFFKTEDNNFQVSEVVLEAKLIDLPIESLNWRGFKGRVFVENIYGKQTYCIYYRKTFYKNGAGVKREMKCFNKNISSKFLSCKTITDLIEAGISEDSIKNSFLDFDRDKIIDKKEKDKYELIPEIWEVNHEQIEWANNPGGIEGVISTRLPKFLLIPAENRKEEIEGASGTLQKTMKELFEEIRDSSSNYKKAQLYLDLLAAELDPDDENKEFGKMILDINEIIGGVFSDTKIHIETSLSDPASTIKPTFNVDMSSNVRTKPERQGMGSIRSTVFALLRYREKFIQRKQSEGVEVRPLIIGFEEPEMYLHPNAVSLMRDKIYELATSSFSKIICTTHSPYMIDLSKKNEYEEFPKQVLNLFKSEIDPNLNVLVSNSIAFNTSIAYFKLQENDKDYIKFILKIDDYLAKVFFCKNIIIVEGDTEEILIKETINRLTEERRKLFLADYQVVKARGKATIIPLVRYLKALSINPFVMHDKDSESGAIKFNTPILEALENDENRRYMVENTIEDLLGYEAPNNEKPYKAYKHISKSWGNEWDEVPEKWRKVFQTKIAPDLFNE